MTANMSEQDALQTVNQDRENDGNRGFESRERLRRIREEVEAKSRVEAEERLRKHQRELARLGVVSKKRFTAATAVIAVLILVIHASVGSILYFESVAEAEERLQAEKDNWDKERQELRKKLDGAAKKVRSLSLTANSAQEAAVRLEQMLNERERALACNRTKAPKRRRASRRVNNERNPRPGPGTEGVPIDIGTDPMGDLDPFGENRILRKRR